MTAPDPTVRPLRRDAAENRDRLLAAASRVFDAQGLEAGVADIARAAGVGMGTLYRRFATKEALIDALVHDVLETIIQMATRALGEPDGTGLERFLVESSAYQAEHRGCLPRLWNTDHEMVVKARELITRLLEDAKQHRRVREELTNTDVTVVLWSIRGILETTGELAPKAWQRHLELLIAGMRPAGAPLAHAPTSQIQIDRILTEPVTRAAVAAATPLSTRSRNRARAGSSTPGSRASS
jgi:AcrR family transcriptional regulator